MAERRYALDALIAATGLTEGALARKVRLSGSTLKLARERGFTEEAAERYAARAGFVVWQVWPEWIEDVIADESRPCEECGQPFVPRRSDQRFCVSECRWRKCSREAYRRRYRSDPAFREQQRQRVLEYQADPRVAEVRRRKQRARDARRRRERAA